MIEWLPVEGSSRIVAEAYDASAEAILVRFTDGVEWCYEGCPPHVWQEFTAPGQSRGKYIHDVLNHRTHHRHAG